MAVTSYQERSIYQQLQADFVAGHWDGVRDHYKTVLNNSLWQKISTDKVGRLARNCQFYHCCPFFWPDGKLTKLMSSLLMMHWSWQQWKVARVLPEARNMLLGLDEGYHIADVVRETLEVEANISLPSLTVLLDNFLPYVEQYLR